MSTPILAPAQSLREQAAIQVIRCRALLLLAVVAFAAPALAQSPQLQHFATSQLTIVTADGSHRFKVEIARTPAQMEQGLM